MLDRIENKNIQNIQKFGHDIIQHKIINSETHTYTHLHTHNYMKQKGKVIIAGQESTGG